MTRASPFTPETPMEHSIALLRSSFDAFRVLLSELRRTAIDRKFGTGGEGRVECEEENGVRNFLRHPKALHRISSDRPLPDMSGRAFLGKHFADDRRVDGTGRYRIDAN